MHLVYLSAYYLRINSQTCVDESKASKSQGIFHIPLREMNKERQVVQEAWGESSFTACLSPWQLAGFCCMI